MTRQVIETGNSFVLVSDTTLPGRTSTPTLVRRTTTSLTLSTTRGPGGVATLYRWRYSTNGTVSDSDPTATSSGSSITISGLSPGTSYWIDVRAENSAGNSSYSGNLATSTTGTTTGTTTDTDSLWCYESSNASSPPSGGRTTRLHSPSGCSRSSLSADTTRWVYKYTRTRTYVNSSFTSATAWGSGTRVHSPTGSPPVTPTTTVSANAGSNASVESGGSVGIGGSDTVQNGQGSTTISWSKQSGTGSSLSSTSTASPTFNAPTVTSQRTIVWRKTVTNNGVSDTDDVTITVTAPAAPTTPLSLPNIGRKSFSSGGRNVDIQLPAASGGTGNYRYSTNQGTLDSSTRILDIQLGSVSSGGSFGVTYTVNDGVNSVSKSFVIEWAGQGGGNGNGQRAPGDGTYRLTVGVEIASALRADPNSPAYLSYIEIDGANEKLNIFIGSTSTSRSAGTDLSSQWETSGRLGIRHTTPSGVSTEWFEAPFDTDNAAPYTNLKAALITLATEDQSEPRTIILDDNALPNASAPTVTINAVPEGNEGTTVRLRATVSGGVYDQSFYVWTVGGGALNTRFPTAPAWTRPAVTADGTVNINLEIHVAGNGTRAASGTSGVVVATTLAATVRNVPVITTDVDKIFRLAATQPAPPTGGTSTQTHTPTDWTRSEPNPTATQTVWRSERTRSYSDGSFASASAWGTPARIYHDIWLAGYTPNRIYRSINNGASWGSAINGPSGQTFINGIAVAPNGNLWLAGQSPDKIYLSKNKGTSWGSAISGPSGQSLISGIAVAPNGDLWLAGSTPDDIYKSTDDGATWSSAGISGPTGQRAIAGIAIAPNGDIWLAGSVPDDVYRSTDNGATWGSGIDGPSLQTRLSGISVAPNGDIWLCGSSGNDIYRSTDNGANWSAEIDGPSGQNRISGIAVDSHTPPPVVTLSTSASTGVPIARAALVAAVLSASVMAGTPTAQANLASSSISIKASTNTPSASANLLSGPLAISASSGVNSASVDIISQLPFDLSWASERGRTVYVSAVITAGVPRGNGTVYEDQPGRTPLGSVLAGSDMESQTGQSVTAIALNELFTGNITFWDAPSPLAWSSFFTDNPDVSLWMQFAPSGPVYPFVARGHGGSYSAWATGDLAAQAAVTAARAEGARFAFVLRGAPATITFFASPTTGVPTGAANLQQPTLSTVISAGVPTAHVNLQGQLLSATASAGVPTATIDIEEQGVGINAYVPPSGYRPIVLAFLEADVSGADITAEPAVTIGTGNDLIVASNLVISQVERHVAGSQIRLRRSGDGEFSTYFDNEGSPLYPDARLQILYDGSLIDGSIANTGGGFNNWSVANSAQRSKLNAIATGERFVLAILKKITIEASVGTIPPAARVALAPPLIAVDASAGVPTARVYFDSLPLSASSTAGTPTARADLAPTILSISASAGIPIARAALVPPTISIKVSAGAPTTKASLVPPTLSASASAAAPTARAYLASLVLTTNDIDLTNLDVYALALINTGTPTPNGTVYEDQPNRTPVGSIDAGGDLTARAGQDITRIALNIQGSGAVRFWDNPSQQSWINFFSTYPRATLRLQFEIPGPAYELTRGGQGSNFSNWSTSNVDARAAITSARANGKKFIFLLAEERIAVRMGEGERGSIATAGVEGIGRKIDAATRSGSGEFGESATEGEEGTGSSQTVTGMGEGEVGRVTASGVGGQGASIVIKKAGSGELGKIITSGKEGTGKKIVRLPSTGSGEFGRISTAGMEGTGRKIDLLPVAGSGEFGKVIIAGVEGAGVKVIPLPSAGSGEFGNITTFGKEGIGRRNAAKTLSGTGEFGTVSSGGIEGGGRHGGDLTGFIRIGEVRGISFPRTGLEGDVSYDITLRSRDRTGNTGNLVSAGTVLTEDLLDVPGAEFVFQRNNTGVVPDPPLSTGKQRKTDDYIPPGWSDNPQGVSVSNRYEYISSRTGSTGRWSEFGPPGLYDIFLVEGETEAQFIFRRTTSASAPNTPRSNAMQKASDSYIPSQWVRSAQGTTETLPYEWASYRLGGSGNWSVFYPPTLREAHPTARGPIPFFRAISGSSWSTSQANLATTGTNVTGDRVTLYNASSDYTETRTWTGRSWITIGKWIDGNLIVEGTVLSIFDIIAGAAVQSSNYRAGVEGWRIAQDGDAEFNGALFAENLQNVRVLWSGKTPLGSSSSPRTFPLGTAVNQFNVIQIYWEIKTQTTNTSFGVVSGPVSLFDGNHRLSHRLDANPNGGVYFKPSYSGQILKLTHDVGYTVNITRILGITNPRGGITTTPVSTVTPTTSLNLPDPSDFRAPMGVDTVVVLPAATGGTGNYTYSVTGLASNTGGSFSAADRTLTVNPTTSSGTDVVTYTVNDGDNTESQTFTITRISSTIPILVVENSSLTVEEGSTTTINVKLSSQPTGNVTVTATENDQDVSVSPSTRTFSTTNWNRYQSFTVTGIVDADSRADSASVSLAGSGSGVIDTATVSISITEPGTTVDPGTPTAVSANAGPNVSVDSGDSVSIGGIDSVTSGVGITTYSWARQSGTGGSLSSSTAQSPTFTAPTVSSNRTIVYRKTTTNNGVSDTDDVTITVTAAPTAPLSLPTLRNRSYGSFQGGQEVTIQLPAASGGTGNYSYSVNLGTFDSSTRILTVRLGEATRDARSFGAIYTVSDGVNSVSKSFQIEIAGDGSANGNGGNGNGGN